MRSREISWAVVLVLLGLATPRAAIGSGWKLEVQGAKALETSYAGAAASAEDASTVWFNPAGMTRLGNGAVTLGVPVIDLTIDLNDRGTTTILGQAASGPASKNGGSVVLVPHFYAVKKLGENVWAGFGINTPFGLGTDYGESWKGRYHATESRLLVFNFNPSLAYKIDERLSLGGGLDVQYSTATFAQMIDFGSIGAAGGLPVSPQQSDGRVRIKGSAWAVGFDVGALWEPVSATRLGLAYHSRTDHDVEGPATFSVPAAAQPLTGGGAVFQNTRAKTSLPMPASISASLDQGIGNRWAVLADVTWTGWSTLSALSITFANPAQPAIVQETDWRDVLRYSVGARYRATERWTFRAGAAYEESPVPAATREPRVPEADHQWVSAGFSYQASSRTEIDFFYVHLFTNKAPMKVVNPTAGTLLGDAVWNIDNVGVSATVRF